MPEDYFPPLKDQAFGIGEKFDYDRFKRWIEVQAWDFKKSFTIQGDIISSNWDGTTPLDLSSEDTGASSGFAFDSSEGAAQLEGNLFVGGDITLSGELTGGTLTGALFRTAASGDRLEVDGPSGDAFISLFDAANDLVGYMGWAATGYGANDLTIATLGNTDNIQVDANGGINLNAAGSSGFGVIVNNPAPAGASPAKPFGVVGDTGAGFLVHDANSAATPTWAFWDDADTGWYLSDTGEMSIATAGTQRIVVNAVGLDSRGHHISLGSLGSGGELRARSAFGVASSGGAGLKAIDHSGANADGLGLYGHDGVSVWVTQTQAAEFKNGGSGSHLELRDGLTDVGNHETLRLNRGSGSTMQNVGYYSSWINDPETGEERKTDIKLVGNAGDWWQREWFLDLEPIKYQRVSHDKAAYGDGEQIEMGFSIENLIEHTPLLTAGGNQVKGTPDEYALLAVTVDYVQHLERRVATLEAA